MINFLWFTAGLLIGAALVGFGMWRWMQSRLANQTEHREQAARDFRRTLRQHQESLRTQTETVAALQQKLAQAEQTLSDSTATQSEVDATLATLEATVRTAEAGLAAEQQRAADLEAVEQTLVGRLDATKAQLEDSQLSLTQAKEEAGVLRLRLQSLESERDTLAHDTSDAIAQAAAMEARLGMTEEQLTVAAAHLATTEDRLTVLQEQLDDANALAGLFPIQQVKLEHLTQQVDYLEETRNRLREEVAAANATNALLRDELRAAKDAAEQMDEALAQAQEELAQLQTRYRYVVVKLRELVPAAEEASRLRQQLVQAAQQLQRQRTEKPAVAAVDEPAVAVVDEPAGTPPSPATYNNGSHAAALPNATLDLQSVNGIGPVYARRLREGGVATLAQLVALPPEELGKLAKLRLGGVDRARAWIDQARALLGRDDN